MININEIRHTHMFHIGGTFVQDMAKLHAYYGIDIVSVAHTKDHEYTVRLLTRNEDQSCTLRDVRVEVYTAEYVKEIESDIIQHEAA